MFLPYMDIKRNGSMINWGIQEDLVQCYCEKGSSIFFRFFIFLKAKEAQFLRKYDDHLHKPHFAKVFRNLSQLWGQQTYGHSSFYLVRLLK